ncbi:sodium:solute symporter family transporter [Luteolibacter sp. AS25]|uniref:sodium:solute symporter family transporter n=1 Tax=Luteolibacter sp. AS25 TaxID=3135776 RepID=UPI00398A5E50
MMIAEINSHILDPATGLLLLVVFGGLWIALGVWWGKKAKSSEGFMLAGRNVGLALGTATAMATWITSNTTMMAPVFALKQGVWGMLAYATASFGLFLFAPMAMRIHKLLPNGYTSGDFFRLRFGNVAWGIFLAISLLYSMSWLVTMAIAGGELVNALSGIDYVTGLTVILLVCIGYTLFGGLFAVIGTDYLQSVIILIGIVVIGVAVLTKTDIPEMAAHLKTTQPSLVSVFMPVALLAVFNNMFFGFGEVFHNNVWWSRVFAMRKSVAPKAFFLAGVLWFPIPIAAGFIALSAGVLGINIVNENMTGPLVASQIMGADGGGTLPGIIIFTVLFCSLASSIDSLLAATSDLITRDGFEKMFKRGVKLEDAVIRKAGKYAIIGIGLLAWLLALPRWPIQQALFLSGPLVASVIWPVIAGLYWQKVNRGFIIAAMILGSASGLWAYFSIGWFVASLISVAVSMLLTVAGRFVAPQTFDWKKLSSDI